MHWAVRRGDTSERVRFSSACAATKPPRPRIRSGARLRHTLITLLVVLLALITLAAKGPSAALATFPGSTGFMIVAGGSGFEKLDLTTGAITSLPLPHGLTGVGEPMWSPDGTQIAFTGTAGEGEEPSAIYIMNADGSGIRQLTHPKAYQIGGVTEHEYDELPAWNPDGKGLAYGRFNTPANYGSGACYGGELRYVEATGSGDTQLANTCTAQLAWGYSIRQRLEWSPSGDYLLGEKFNPNTLSFDLDVFDLNGTTVLRRPDSWGFDWLPNGQEFVTDEESGIVRVALAGGSETIPGTADTEDARVTPDGNYVIYLPDPDCGFCSPVEQRLSYPNAEPPSPTEPLERTLPVSLGEIGDIQPQQLPIIYLPGILSSEIDCNQSPVWPPAGSPFPNLSLLELAPDGKTNAGCGSAGPGNAIGKIFGTIDVGAGVSSFLAGLKLPPGAGGGPFPTKTLGWDWRKRPQESVERLEEFVMKQLDGPLQKAEGVTRVTLMGHSYGGLLIRAFMEQHQNQVGRVLTVGTPYLGAPKAIFPLAFGVTAPLEPLGADLLLNRDELQMLARNLSGLYELFPTSAYGHWLRESKKLADVPTMINNLRGNVGLFEEAQNDHEKQNGFDSFPLTPQDGIEYQEVVGAGLATPIGIELTPTPFEGYANVEIALGNGDGTVPLRSSTQAQPVPPPPYHTQELCGVKHDEQPGNKQMLKAYEGYLTSGARPLKLGAACAAAGGVWKFETQTGLELGGAPAALLKSPDAGRAVAGRAVAEAPAELSLEEASDDDLAEVFIAGPQVFAIVNNGKPIALSFDAENLAFSYHPLEGETMGPTATYGPLTGHVVLAPSEGGATPVVTLDGESVVPRFEEEAYKEPGTGSGPTGGGLSNGGSGTSGASSHQSALRSPPVLTDLLVRPRLLRLAHGIRAKHKRGSRGATITYGDSEAATTTVTVEREAAGVAHGHACVALTRKTREKRHHCTRYITTGTLTHADTAGGNTIRFEGTLAGHALAPGTYRLVLVAHNVAGYRSQELTAILRITG
jgi:Lecithin:cholesterol acyltransferase/WD40-like Beta Propeller Repeat